jgi:hypothetical protein
MVMLHIALCTPCIALYVVVSYSHFLVDPAEQEPEELQEPAPVEDTNTEQEQGKFRCI